MKRRDLLKCAALLGLAGPSSLPRALARTPDDVDAPSVPPPAGATVLFDGRDLSKWLNRKNGEPAAWTVENGWMEVKPGVGDIHTRETFRDFRLHVEFWVPHMPNATGQGRGNSGVYLQGKYEIQVLDSYGIEKPKINDCGAIYSIAVPLRNACKKPEKWQTYDITFRAPRFDDAGTQTSRGVVTVLQNGILIHDRQEFDAKVTTSGMNIELPKPGPIMLQDHENKVRYRNIWLIPGS